MNLYFYFRCKVVEVGRLYHVTLARQRGIEAVNPEAAALGNESDAEDESAVRMAMLCRPGARTFSQTRCRARRSKETLPCSSESTSDKSNCDSSLHFQRLTNKNHMLPIPGNKDVHGS